MSTELFKGGNPEVGLVVRDLDTMTTFYNEALRLTHITDLPIEGGLMRRFACGGAVVKLLKMEEGSTESNPPGGIGGGSGIRWITVKLDHDLDTAARRCLDAGGREVVPVGTVPTGATIAIVEDPEGNWIELVGTP